MMFYTALVFFLLFSSTAQSQEVKVRSLFENRSLIPHALLPFRVSGPLMDQGWRLSKVEVRSENSTACRSMVDPFLADLFYVKCTAPTRIFIDVQMSSFSRVQKYNLGSLLIRDVGEGLTVVAPPVGGPDVSALEGKRLYANNCLTCHNPPLTLKGRSAVVIQAKINSVGQMLHLRQFLTSEDVIAIEKYLKDPK